RRGDRRTYPRERGSAGYQWAFAPKWCIGRWACTIRGLPTVAGTPAVRAGVSGPHAVNPHGTRAFAQDQGMHMVLPSPWHAACNSTSSLTPRASATYLAMSIENITRLINDLGNEFIGLRFTDMRGVWHHVTFPASLAD